MPLLLVARIPLAISGAGGFWIDRVAAALLFSLLGSNRISVALKAESVQLSRSFRVYSSPATGRSTSLEEAEDERSNRT